MMVAELDGKGWKSEEFEIKLLETFSLPKPTLNGFNSTSETEIKSKLKTNYLSELDSSFQPTYKDEPCDHAEFHHSHVEFHHDDHTYSITSSPLYRQNHEHTATTNLAPSPSQLSPSIIKTGELTMKIVNSITALVPPEEPSKEFKHFGIKANRDTSKILASFNNYKHTRSKANNIVNVIQPIEFCVNCRQDLFTSIQSSVFCLKTGNVLITCQNCSIKMSMKGAFKLPKYL